MRPSRLAPLAALLIATAPLAQEIPGWDGEPYTGTVTLSAGFSGDPHTIDVRPGGTVANPIEGVGCSGYIGMRPDVVLDYAAGDLLDLTVSVASETDVSLVVRTPDGRYLCDDDSGVVYNPLLTIEDPPAGTYRIWAGVFASSDEYVDGVVGFSELGRAATVGDDSATPPPAGVASGLGGAGGTATASGTVEGWDGEPYFGTAVLRAGFTDDPHLITVRAGGSQPNPLDGVGCQGSIGFSPDAVVRYTAGSLPLTFSASAGQDLSLVVRTPSGRYYCDDDSGEGLNPRLDFEEPESGDYRVWVGTYTEGGAMVDGQLGVSELGREAQ